MLQDIKREVINGKSAKHAEDEPTGQCHSEWCANKVIADVIMWKHESSTRNQAYYRGESYSQEVDQFGYEPCAGANTSTHAPYGC